jgi:transcription antitermination factor NusG
VLQTRSNCERRIADGLTGQGIETYLPEYREAHQWKDRRRWVSIPLFPGYVFVHISDQPAVRRTVIETAGVVGFVGSVSRMDEVPEPEIEAVRRMLRSPQGCSPHPFLQQGCRVRVKRGSLEGIDGVLIRFKNQARLVVSIPLLGKAIAAEIDVRDVEVLASGRPGENAN